jgi:hypothetical protein
MSFTDKIANGSAIMLIEYFSPHPNSSNFAEYYRYVMVYVPGLAAVFALLMLAFIVYTGIPIVTSETPSIPSSPVPPFSGQLIESLKAQTDHQQQYENGHPNNSRIPKLGTGELVINVNGIQTHETTALLNGNKHTKYTQV